MPADRTRVLRRERRRAWKGMPGHSTLARRTLPEHPTARALLTAQHARQITGPQHQIVTCWFCGTDYPEHQYGEDGWTAGPGGEPVCGDQDACNDRAAEAGLVLVLGDPGHRDDINSNGGN